MVATPYPTVEVEAHGKSATCTVIRGDNRDVLPTLPWDRFDLCVTSPPYFQQREYGRTGIGNEDTAEE